MPQDQCAEHRHFCILEGKSRGLRPVIRVMGIEACDQSPGVLSYLASHVKNKRLNIKKKPM